MTAAPGRSDTGRERATGEIVAGFALGCCGDAEWRGRYCQYHQGFEAGMDEATERAATALRSLSAAAAAVLEARDRPGTDVTAFLVDLLAAVDGLRALVDEE